MNPTGFDVWVVSFLAGVSATCPLLNLVVESGLETRVFGGVWYAAALFVLWTDSARFGDQRLRRGLLTIVWASLLAGAFSILVGLLIGWTPPRNRPDMMNRYPADLWPNLNTNSFPSQSTAVYVSVATGIRPLRRRLGTVLWLIAVVLVALPRVYVGGHYPSDVVGGVLVGLTAYLVAVRLLGPWLNDRLASVIAGERSWRAVVLLLTVFVWIFELATGFHEVVWLFAALKHHVLRGL